MISHIPINVSASDVNEQIIFQDDSFSQNNLISEISSNDDLLYLINSSEFNDNFFYALFDPLTNSNIYPSYSSKEKFFIEKIKLFSDKPYGYQINSIIFENVLFETFNSPELNKYYLNYLFNSNQINEMCLYLSSLTDDKKNFEDSIQFNILCLLVKKQFSQISLLLEIYSEEEINSLNSNFLINFLDNKNNNNEYNLSELSFIDKYIISVESSYKLNIDQISSLFDLNIYMQGSNLESYQINSLFKNRIINVQQYISLLSLLEDKPNELLMYDEIFKEINYNKKLQILERYIPLTQLDAYDLSRLINDQFTGMRITSRNLNNINALMLLSLYENSIFLENLINVLENIPEDNIENNFIALGLKSYLTKDMGNNSYIDDKEHLKSPLMKFLFLNNNLKFADIKKDNFIVKNLISVNPIYLFHLAENFNLLASYTYYLGLSEKHYDINEFDLYFLNKYLIQNEYLENELIKLSFKVHLSNI